jgi:NADPH-dependent ferric siderophore reductase
MVEASAHTVLTAFSYDHLCNAARADAQAYDYPILSDDHDGMKVETYYGTVGFDRIGEGMRIEIASDGPDTLQTLKDSLVARIEEIDRELALSVRWSDNLHVGKLPGNAQIMRVCRKEQLDCGFIRMTLQGDVTRFTPDAIHFRLGFPSVDHVAPEWPYIGENGATVWPKGEATLHRPVYTALKTDPAAGMLVFDVFQHAGGRATRWAAQVRDGTEVLVTGPGGGGCRITGPILGFADETAFPALARLLDANAELVGSVHIWPCTQAGKLYPFPDHPSVSFIYHDTEDAVDMPTLAATLIGRSENVFLWCAGERGQVDQVRASWKQIGGTAKRSYISAYWQRSED